MSAERTGIVAVAARFDRDLERTYAKLERIFAASREQGAGLVVLPECTLGGYLREPDGSGGLDVPTGLDPDGPEVARLAELAGDLVVCCGYSEAGDGDALHTSAVCVGDGEVLGHQRKVHLPPGERFAYTAGDTLNAFDTPVGRIGMLLCYDKLFPEAARALALDGAQTICCPAAWPVDRREPARRVRADRQTRHFDLVDQARAVENQVVWVSSNQVGRWGPVRFLGGAKVVDPDGVILARTHAREGLAVAHVDVAAAVAESRLGIDHLGDRRPEAYARASAERANAAHG